MQTRRPSSRAVVAVSLALAAFASGCSRSVWDRTPDAGTNDRSRANRIVPSRGPALPTQEDFDKRAAALRERLGDDFHVVVERPFVVIGDEAPDVVEGRAVRTVRWATTRLKKLYFPRDPERIIDVWLFKNKESYRTHCAAFFDTPFPSTPFGFYSPSHDALVMNIATGGGTLVHEMVHAFMDPNFPQCPAWFNEGLASLYEQCGSKHGRIWGFTNWRLTRLQDAIRERVVPTFETLTGTTREEFYEKDPGTNYAQARYLCYYLQEKKKLLPFWRAFLRNVHKDPTGYATLKEILGNRDMEHFQTEWEFFVLHLRR